jgi:hypothetical protein
MTNSPPKSSLGLRILITGVALIAIAGLIFRADSERTHDIAVYLGLVGLIMVGVGAVLTGM